MSAPNLDTVAPSYDTPWKIALEQHFQTFIAFYFPRAYPQIDWALPHEFLDKELQAISKEALVGVRHVDKLVKVHLKNGAEEWLYIHIEIQISRQSHFAQRMFVYNYRIFDRYSKPVASMAVLGDDDPKWLPAQFTYSALDCQMDFHFPIAKLTHYAGHEGALAQDRNPFALLTLAYLKSRATRRNMPRRYAVKCELIRLLYSHQWDKDLIRQFFLVIDWMLELPPDLDLQLSNFVRQLEEEQKMEYVSSVERVLLERSALQGRQEGKLEGQASLLCHLLARRFGALPDDVQLKIQSASLEQIQQWFDTALDASSLAAVFPDISQ